MSGRMKSDRAQALAEFRRMMKWIALVAVLMVGGAIAYLFETGDVDLNMIVATMIGVFFSILLGCGLFAAAFFSSKSGIDQDITDSTRSERDRR